MSSKMLKWEWQPRTQPGQPQAAVAWGEAALRLHARLLLMPENQGLRLQATASRDVLVVAGDAADLPWVEGIDYACSDSRAPGLWLPTSWEPDVQVDLLGQALALRFARAPMLLWREPPAVVPLDRLLTMSMQHLRRIEAYWGGTDATTRSASTLAAVAARLQRRATAAVYGPAGSPQPTVRAVARPASGRRTRTRWLG